MNATRSVPVARSVDGPRRFMMRTIRIAVAMNVVAILILQGDRAFDPHRQARASDRERHELTTDVVRYGTAVTELAGRVRADQP